jgi:hypothetical protein
VESAAVAAIPQTQHWLARHRERQHACCSYSDLAGQGWVDWLYMISMAVIGVAQLVRLAAIGGPIWMVLFYTAAAIWPENNPSLDDHVVEFIILLGLAYVPRGATSGSGGGGSRGRCPAVSGPPLSAVVGGERAGVEAGSRGSASDGVATSPLRTALR